MKKYFYSALAVLVFTIQYAYAVPAYPGPVTFTQPNGDTLTVMIRGDERIHWYESIDEYTLLLNTSGYLTYALLDEEGNLQASDLIAADIQRRSVVAHSFLSKVEKKLFYSDMQKQLMLKIWQIEDRAGTMSERAVTGTYKILCALVQFPEKSMIKTISQFDALLNQLGYTGNGTGSVRDYFKETSYNQFDLEITVCGIYTAPNSEIYYAGPPGDGTARCPELARWLAQQVAAEPSIDFRDYDANNDGVVDAFHFIFAGIGQETGQDGNAIWSHKSAFYPVVTQNGTRINEYSCSPELLSGTNITTIGVICHEMSHVFGAPDFYDTNYEIGGEYQGTGRWDLMADGSWNGYPDGNRPAHHNMYTKVQFGWVTPTVLSAPTSIVNMPNAAENPVAYRINTTTNNEYFLLENRQQLKFDTNIPGNGLIIYRVHSSLGMSGINNTHPQRMYPVAANATVAIPSAGSATYGNINSSTCPWPVSGKTEFTDTSIPSMRSWANANTNKPITNITRSSGLISFDFMGGAHNPNNADLQELGVSEGTLTPAFAPNTTNYTVTVPNDISNITISATPVNMSATVTGAGSKVLDIGDNPFSILVASGTATKTYTVVVTRRHEPITFIDFTLASGAPIALRRAVELTYTFSGGEPTHFRAAESESALNTASWQAYTSKPTYSFASDTHGEKTVYTQLCNTASTTTSKSATIIYKPIHQKLSLSSLVINGGASRTTNRTITLNHTTENGVPTAYSVSENPANIGQQWLAYELLPRFTLSENTGMKEVLFAVANAIDTSAIVSARIYLDESATVEANGLTAELFPNPANNIVNVVIDEAMTPVLVSIYSITGEICLSQTYTTSTFSIDLSRCPSGILLVRIANGDKFAVKKMVKL
ncbi:MAG: M6 family metalloprotease domain-containing protein [Bacteroidales bacterium]|nr:M6 family metalloprotease domain-containing protein [Bacteroidales bacterium]MCL2133699.1 M6 family metalloprotease domain-containing protein [Bacteroidales bacterium]